MGLATDMEFLLAIARCPRTGQTLRRDGGRLITADGKLAYRLEDGIPVLLPTEGEEAAP